MPKKKKNKNHNLTFFNILVFVFVFFLPTQLGKHFFFPFSYLGGVRVDYLAPTVYISDVLFFIIALFQIKNLHHFFRMKWLYVLFAVLTVHSAFAINPVVGLYKTVKIFELIFIFFLFSRSSISTRSVVLGFFSSAVFQLILTLLQFINKQTIQGFFWFFGERLITLSTPDVAKASLGGVEFLRPYGTFSHPNSLAGYFLLLYALVLGSSFIKSQVFRRIFIGVTSVLVFFSFSKIAITVYLAVTIFDRLKNARFYKDCRLCFIAGILVPLVLGLVFLSAQTDPSSLQKRGVLILNALVIIVKNPLFGVGLGNYIYAQYSLPQSFLLLFTQPVHNIFMLALGETGILLFLTGLAFLFRFVINNVRSYSFLLVFSTLAITGLFDHYWWTLQQNFLLIGVVFGLLKQTKLSENIEI